MKYLKAGVVAVMILAVSGTAGAVSLKPGPAFFHAENWDMATIYVHDTPGVYDPGDFTPWDGVGVPPAVPYKIVPKGAEPNEDSWGVFRLREIIEGRIKPDGYIAPDSPTPYWRSGDNNEEILGVFWGLQDTQVTIKQDLSWEVTADNMQLELWCMPAAGFGAFYPPVAGSAGRTAFNRYAGWVDGTGTPLLRGESGSYVYTSNFASPSLEGQTTISGIRSWARRTTSASPSPRRTCICPCRSATRHWVTGMPTAATRGRPMSSPSRSRCWACSWALPGW